jgi:AraC-like DNA-binding protein
MYLSRRLFGKKPAVWDLIHLFPFLLFLIDYFPYIILSADAKLQIYLQEAKDPMRLKLAYAEGWFMPAFGHVIMRHTLFFGYWVAQVFMLRRALQNPNHPLVYQSPQQTRWLQMLVGSQLLVFIPPLLALGFGGGQAVGHWINVAAFTASLIQVYYLVFHPEVLYSLDTAYLPSGDVPEIDKHDPAIAEILQHVSAPQEEKNPTSINNVAADQMLSSNEESLRAIHAVVESTMNSLKPFTKVRYGIGDLSKDTGIPAYRLSQFINKKFNLNFYGYLNQFRIQYCLEKIKAGEHEIKTLEALAKESGFQSRATFARAFKQVTGLKPSEFIAQTS